MSSKPVRQLSFVLYLMMAFVAVFLFSACHSSKAFRKGKSRSYKKMIEQSEVFEKAFTGFALYDPIKRKMIYEREADKYFTPASNTKIFTLYTSLRILGDSMPMIQYMLQGDSLIFWGTGHPSLLHPYLPADSSLIAFLQNWAGDLYFSNSNMISPAFGPGWAWDDYPYYYQAERSSLPIYGNVVQFDQASTKDSLRVHPPYFKDRIQLKASMGGAHLRIRRQRHRNIFDTNGKAPSKGVYGNDLPFSWSDSLLVELLGQACGREIGVVDRPLPQANKRKLFYQNPGDTLYTRLMQESDNFIAEQLLLLCSQVLLDSLDSDRLIDTAKVRWLADLPDAPRWVDGSGLSRYNLFTPRSVVKLLDKLLQEYSEERLLRIFPAGGQSGTIKYWYGGKEEPYVFAKTGTLSNKHCLSGYLRTRSGRLLIFSFMHNNYMGSSRHYKKEMEEILMALHAYF